MARKFFIGLVCAALLSTSLACQFTTASGPAAKPPSAETVVSQATAPQPTPSATIDTQATAKAEEEHAAATATAVEEAAAQEKEQAATETAVAKATEQESSRIAGTATVEAAATAQADDMLRVVRELNSNGVLQSSEGTYHPIADFIENWAQINWYQWWTTGYQPNDFVIRAHTAWESASKTANWFSSGCGFVFRAKDEKNHFMIFLALDSNVYLKGYINGDYRELGKEYAGKINHLKGEADVMLVVQGDKIVYYVNNQKVFERQNKELKEGDLGLTLVSGTNLDYGTRCEMTNIELWELSQ